MSNKNDEILPLAIHLLSLRAQSRFELHQKLLKKFPEEGEEVEKVLNRCQELGYLNDAQFAQDFLHYQIQRKPQGNLLLRHELRRKGIADVLIEQALTEISPSENVRAESAGEKKWQTYSVDLSFQKKKEKLFRFLQSRGFLAGAIQKFLEKKEGEEKNFPF